MSSYHFVYHQPHVLSGEAVSPLPSNMEAAKDIKQQWLEFQQNSNIHIS